VVNRGEGYGGKTVRFKGGKRGKGEGGKGLEWGKG
jgi:hypothetical protein